jgi:hypothetical protein
VDVAIVGVREMKTGRQHAQKGYKHHTHEAQFAGQSTFGSLEEDLPAQASRLGAKAPQHGQTMVVPVVEAVGTLKLVAQPPLLDGGKGMLLNDKTFVAAGNRESPKHLAL